jgi:hypothetical protein
VIIIRLHNSINQVLSEYINLWKERLPNRLEGLYIHGSIVLDAFIDDSSDIDFVIMTNNRLTEKEVKVLSDIHTVIAGKFDKPKLDGSFIIWKDLGKIQTEHNDSYPYYNEGKIEFTSEFNPITWWLLKNKGISILGPDITQETFNTDSSLLTTYVIENMNSYWAGRVHNMENSIERVVNLPVKDIDEEVEWSVLGLLRQYYTLKEKGIISKVGAGEYGLLNLPEEWHSIITEALNIRKNIRVRIFNSEEKRLHETLNFSKFLIQYCNRMQEQ